MWNCPDSNTGPGPQRCYGPAHSLATTAWVKSLVDAGFHLAAQTFSWGLWKPGVEETRAGWEGAGTLEPAPEPDRTDVSAESEEAGSWDRWQVGRPGACYPDRFPLYRLADQSHDGHTRAFRSISAAFELRLLLQIDPRSHVDNTPERFTDPKVLLHSVHAHSPAGYT